MMNDQDAILFTCLSVSVGHLLLFMIRQCDASMSMKLHGYYILFDSFLLNKSTESPFLPAIISCYEAAATSSENNRQLLIEEYFLGQLLTQGGEAIRKQTPIQIANLNADSMININKTIQSDMAKLKETQIYLPTTVRHVQHTVVPAP